MTRRDKVCKKCAHIFERGGDPAWGPFFFVCSDGHVNSIDLVDDRLRLVPNMPDVLLRDALRMHGVTKRVQRAIHAQLKNNKKLFGLNAHARPR